MVVSQHLGRGDPEGAGRAAGQLVWLTGGVAVAMSAVGVVVREPLVRGVFGDAEAEVLEQAMAYFAVIVLSFPFLGLYNAGAALLRSISDTGTSLWIALMMNLINVAGNALLIYGCAMGVKGAAFASLAARAAAAVVILGLLLQRHTPFALGRGLSAPLQAGTVGAILRIGVPSGVENGMFQIGKLLVQRLVASFGTVAIAANAAAGNIACIATIPGSAISLALLSVVGRCMGAHRPDEAAAEIIPGTAATELDFDTEFLDYILAVAVVDDLDAAIAHVQHHSTHHSDCIVTENQAAADRFVDEVDSAAVYVNVSTRFTDGGEFGLGCEMGISTQKLHARGPMGLDELSTYKYVITGSGQIR